MVGIAESEEVVDVGSGHPALLALAAADVAVAVAVQPREQRRLWATDRGGGPD